MTRACAESVAACLTTFVSASWTMRYPARSTPRGRRRGSPWTRRSTRSPACAVRSARASRSASPGVDSKPASRAGGASSRRTPSRTRISWSVARLVALESVLIAFVGTAEGLLLGLAWGAALQRGPEKVLAIPWTTIAEIVAVVGLAGLAAALVPAVRASRLNVLDAIATD
ncbi:ABC transporter permease [Actinomadura logoneensis]|uniref:ABC transporter permease n=1 Tax=Actinomadura logoneensis TaxID=2293572 RepID=A0A372J9A4_9ACTN|nr:ABC transporter permease [Actinomadura logoneensis]